MGLHPPSANSQTDFVGLDSDKDGKIDLAGFLALVKMAKSRELNEAADAERKKPASKRTEGVPMVSETEWEGEGATEKDSKERILKQERVRTAQLAQKFARVEQQGHQLERQRADLRRQEAARAERAENMLSG